jgi:hypothetical protein
LILRWWREEKAFSLSHVLLFHLTDLTMSARRQIWKRARFVAGVPECERGMSRRIVNHTPAPRGARNTKIYKETPRALSRRLCKFPAFSTLSSGSALLSALADNNC